MHLGAIHVLYKGNGDWNISSLIKNQSIDWKMAKSMYVFILNTVHRRAKRMKIWTIRTMYTAYICQIWLKEPNRKLVSRNRKLDRISEMERRRAKRTKIWNLWAIYAAYICQIWSKKRNTKLVSRNRKLGPISETGSIYTACICQKRQKKLNRKLVPPNRKKQEV